MSFTEGDTRWIKRHTQKSLKELNNMKPTSPILKTAKKRPAKRKPLHGFKNELIAKLMNLKYILLKKYFLKFYNNYWSLQKN